VLGVDEGGDPPVALRLGDDVDGQDVLPELSGP
jgi:hypothetical protein